MAENVIKIFLLFLMEHSENKHKAYINEKNVYEVKAHNLIFSSFHSFFSISSSSLELHNIQVHFVKPNSKKTSQNMIKICRKKICMMCTYAEEKCK